MNREAALIRSLYIRTLTRHVGPLLGWRVRNADNDLRSRTSPGDAQRGAGSSPGSHPTLSQPIHAAPYTGETA